MRAKQLIIIGMTVMIILMILTILSINLYINDSSAGMLAMGACSSGMMLFAMIFGAVYMNNTESASSRYEDRYRRCPDCDGAMKDGICVKCGKKV